MSQATNLRQNPDIGGNVKTGSGTTCSIMLSGTVFSCDGFNSFCIIYFPYLVLVLIYREAPNGLRYLRWGGDGEAVQPENGKA
jgi:hypothetical protein